MRLAAIFLLAAAALPPLGTKFKQLPAGEYGLAIRVLPESEEVERAAAYG